MNPLHALLWSNTGVCVFTGTVRRFLENHGNGIEAVVFAVSDTEEVCTTSVCFPQPPFKDIQI